MNVDLSNKVAVLFGAGGLAGLDHPGEGYAEAFVRHGARVLLVSGRVSADKLAAQIMKSTDAGPDVVKLYHADVSLQERNPRFGDVNGAHDALNYAIEQFGGIDIVVNGAGGVGAAFDSVAKLAGITQADAEKVVKTNLLGKFYSLQKFLTYLKASERQGNVVNVTSVSATPGLTRVVLYGASYAGVDALTAQFGALYAQEGCGRVNGLRVGFSPAEQNRALLFQPDGQPTPRGEDIIEATPIGRYLSPRDLVPTMLFLVDPNSTAGITG